MPERFRALATHRYPIALQEYKRHPRRDLTRKTIRNQNRPNERVSRSRGGKKSVERCRGRRERIASARKRIARVGFRAVARCTPRAPALVENAATVYRRRRGDSRGCDRSRSDDGSLVQSALTMCVSSCNNELVLPFPASLLTFDHPAQPCYYDYTTRYGGTGVWQDWNLSRAWQYYPRIAQRPERGRTQTRGVTYRCRCLPSGMRSLIGCFLRKVCGTGPARRCDRAEGESGQVVRAIRTMV